MARHYVHVQVKHHLAARGLVELLHGDAVGLERLHRRGRDFMSAARDMGEILRGDIENVAGKGFWNDQGMPGTARHDVEKGQHMVVLIDLVAGEFAAQDLCKRVLRVVGGHGGS